MRLPWHSCLSASLSASLLSLLSLSTPSPSPSACSSSICIARWLAACQNFCFDAFALKLSAHVLQAASFNRQTAGEGSSEGRGKVKRWWHQPKAGKVCLKLSLFYDLARIMSYCLCAFRCLSSFLFASLSSQEYLYLLFSSYLF